MTANRNDASALDQALAGLRTSLAEAELPPGREDELLAAFRARASAGAPARARWPARVRLAAAAVAVLAVAIVATTAGDFGRESPAVTNSPAGSAPGSGTAGPATTLAVNGFQPLLSGPTYSPSASYSIVRVRIPLSALSPGTPSGATIEADLLVGEDGLASGIRFSPADTVFVSTAEQ
jgi:hypothetical protein